jgi:hypothetical protein
MKRDPKRHFWAIRRGDTLLAMDRQEALRPWLFRSRDLCTQYCAAHHGEKPVKVTLREGWVE